MTENMTNSTEVAKCNIPKKSDGSYDRFVAFRLAVIRAIARCWNDPQVEKNFIDDPKNAFKKHLKYDFPFDMELKLIPESGQWDLAGVNDWRCIKPNKLELKIPPAPKPEHQAEALAAFMARQHTFLE